MLIQAPGRGEHTWHSGRVRRSCLSILVIAKECAGLEVSTLPLSPRSHQQSTSQNQSDTQVNEGGMSSIQTSSCPARGCGILGSLLPSKENSPEQHMSLGFTCPSNVSLPCILFSHAHLASTAGIYSFLNTCTAQTT